MAQSLVKLTLESNQYERNLRNAQKQWNQFINGIGLSVSKFTAVGAAITAVSGALKVAKDAFFKNEQQLDDWGRTVEASKSIYNGFLNSINNGDISGFLSNINNITQAARDAYDALDELSTFNSFNQIQTQKARTGFTEAMAGFRMGEGTKESVQEAAKAYQDELRTRQQKEQEAYSQAVRKIAAERGVPWGNLEQALTGKYGDYEALKNTQPTGKRIVNYGGGMFGGGGSYEVPMAVTAQEKMGEALRKLNDTELKELQALGAQAERTGEEIAQIDKQMARVLNGRGGATTGGGKIGGGGGGRGIGRINTKSDQTEMQSNQQRINELTQEYVSISDNATAEVIARQNAIRQEIALLNQRNNVLKLYAEQAQGKLQGGDIQTSGLGDTKSFADKSYMNIGSGIDSETLAKMNSVGDAGKDAAKSWQMAAGAISNVGAAMNSIEDPTMRIMAIVAQAIASVAAGAGQAISAKDTTASGWAWIGAAAAITASMISMIAAIHNATGYAEGGVVDGKAYSGDNIPIMANAGEIVLSKSMQSTLAANLKSQNTGLNIVGELQGEKIVLVANRYFKRTGQGEIVTW